MTVAQKPEYFEWLSQHPKITSHGFVATFKGERLNLTPTETLFPYESAPTLSVLRAPYDTKYDTILKDFGMSKARLLLDIDRRLDVAYTPRWKYVYESPLLMYSFEQEQTLRWAIPPWHKDRLKVQVYATPWLTLVGGEKTIVCRDYAHPDVLKSFNSIHPHFRHFSMPAEDNEVDFTRLVLPLLQIRTPGTVALRYMYDPAPSNQRSAVVFQQTEDALPRAAALYKMFKVTSEDAVPNPSTYAYRGGSILHLAKLLSQFLDATHTEFRVLYVDVLISNADFSGAGKQLMEYLYTVAQSLADEHDVYLILEPKTQALLRVYAKWTLGLSPLHLVSVRPGVYYMGVRCPKHGGSSKHPLTFYASANVVRDSNKAMKRDVHVADLLKAEDAFLKNIDKVVWCDLSPMRDMLVKAAEQARFLLQAHETVFKTKPSPALAWRTFLSIKSRIEAASSYPAGVQATFTCALNVVGAKEQYISSILN